MTRSAALDAGRDGGRRRIARADPLLGGVGETAPSGCWPRSGAGDVEAAADLLGRALPQVLVDAAGARTADLLSVVPETGDDPGRGGPAAARRPPSPSQLVTAPRAVRALGPGRGRAACHGLVLGGAGDAAGALSSTRPARSPRRGFEAIDARRRKRPGPARGGVGPTSPRSTQRRGGSAGTGRWAVNSGLGGEPAREPGSQGQPPRRPDAGRAAPTGRPRPSAGSPPWCRRGLDEQGGRHAQVLFTFGGHRRGPPDQALQQGRGPVPHPAGPRRVADGLLDVGAVTAGCQLWGNPGRRDGPGHLASGAWTRPAARRDRVVEVLSCPAWTRTGPPVLDRQVRDTVAALRGDGLRVVWGGSLAIRGRGDLLVPGDLRGQHGRRGGRGDRRRRRAGLRTAWPEVVVDPADHWELDVGRSRRLRAVALGRLAAGPRGGRLRPEDVLPITSSDSALRRFLHGLPGVDRGWAPRPGRRCCRRARSRPVPRPGRSTCAIA